MPYFPSVGFIDDAVFTTPEDVMREYHRRYSLAAYHARRASLVRAVSPEAVCLECARTLPTPFRRSSTDLTLVWRDDKAAAKAQALGVKRANYLGTAKRETVKKILRAKLVEALCDDHAKRKLWGKGTYTHGTYWGAYRHKCQCDDCLEYRADHILRRREDRRAKKADTQRAETATVSLGESL